MTRRKRALRWVQERLKDLFYATGNENLELGRTVTGITTSLIVFVTLWNSLHLGQPIDLNGFLTGLAAFIAASGLGIAAKDWVRNKLKKDTATQDAAVKLAENVDTAAVLLAANVQKEKDNV